MLRSVLTAIAVRGAVSAILVVAVIAPAAAQSAAETAGKHDSDAGPGTLEEVVVTSRKREERVQDVPESISVFGATAIEQSGIRSVIDVASRVPNFSIVQSEQPGTEAINIRGVGQVRNGQPPVAVVIDGVQLASGYQITQELFDVEQIEVLKGPQGAVYGRNAIGGAINIVTRQPTNKFEGDVQVGYGTGDDRRAGAYFSGPILPDLLLFRAAVSWRDFTGDIYNKTLDRDVNGDNTRDARFNLLAYPTRSLTLDLRYSHVDSNDGGAWYSFVPAGQNINQPLAPTANVPGSAGRVLSDTALKADLDLGGATVTSISSYSTIRGSLAEDFDYLPADYLSADQVLEQSDWSQELRLTSKDGGPLKWLAGAYYLHSNKKLDSLVYLDPGASFVLVPFPVETTTLFAATRATDYEDAYAGFGQISYRAGQVETALALREDIDDLAELDRVALSRYSKRFTSLQPKLSSTYFVTDNAMVYASAGKGFRSGGFNPSDHITRLYQPETNWNFELGTKFTGMRGRLTLDASVFNTLVRDRQIYTLDLVSGSQAIANPVERAIIRGFEFDVVSRPLGGLELSLGGGYLWTEITRYDPNVYAGLPAAGNFTGNKLPETPPVSYTASAQYTLGPLSGFGVTGRIEANGSAGAYYWEVDNRDERSSLLLMAARLIGAKGPLTVTGSVDNLLNRQYVLEYVSQRFSGSPFGNYSQAASGRRFGVTIKYAF